MQVSRLVLCALVMVHELVPSKSTATKGDVMNPVIKQSSSVEEIRARNGFKVVVAGFTTVLVAFIAAMFVWSNHLEPTKAIASSDIVALLGVLTGVVGTLVGSYFGVSSANSAKDSMSAQLTSANSAHDTANAQLSKATDLNTRLSAALAPDVARSIVP